MINEEAIKALEQQSEDAISRDLAEYEKDLNELKEQILKEGNTLLTKRDLLERFCKIDKEYNGRSWNLLQMLANINILIGQEPCEDVISRADALMCMTGEYIADMTYKPEDIISKHIKRLRALPSVQPKYNTSEWCHDCKEYDHDKHCCPRFNRVIRNTIDEMKQQKIKTGRWIDNHTTCDCCGWQMIDDVMESPNMVFFSFCPNCGAKMLEPQAESEG